MYLSVSDLFYLIHILLQAPAEGTLLGLTDISPTQ